MAAPRLGVEPGARSWRSPARHSIALAVKRQSQRTFVVVDGGIAENPRPALYGAHHHVAAATLPGARAGDHPLRAFLRKRRARNGAAAPRHCAGDLLAMCSTGAYTYSMAGNYNRFPRPAVVRRRRRPTGCWRGAKLSTSPAPRRRPKEDESGRRAAAF